jgi:hypothetical protein
MMTPSEALRATADRHLWDGVEDWRDDITEFACTAASIFARSNPAMFGLRGLVEQAVGDQRLFWAAMDRDSVEQQLVRKTALYVLAYALEQEAEEARHG